MASMTQADDTPHNIRARELYAVFTDETQPDNARARACDDFFFQFENLAYSYARTIIPRWDDNDAEDIRQTAAVALCCARDMWNPERGPFAVILMYCVRNEMRNWLRQKDLIVRSHRTFGEHARQVKEGADASTTERIRVVSLDAMTDNSSPSDNITRIEVKDPKATHALLETDIKVAVRQVVERLPVNERAVVTNYYGLDGDEPKTLRDTATVVGRSHETVRQALARAERTMRNSLHGYA
jgi:RNA polymerase sigma factor (sigma-70 family)